MTNKNTAWALSAVAALAAVTFGCSTPRTKVSAQWKDPTHAATVGKMHKVVVISQNMAPSMGKSLEDEFVDELEDKGVDAVAGHKVFGDKVPDRSEMKPVLSEQGFEGALFLSLANVDQVIKAQPQASYYYNSSPFGYPGSGYDSPRLATEVNMQIDAGLWDLRDGKQVWGSRATVENASKKDLSNRTSKKVVGELSKQDLLR